jgi:NADPH2:quinone reductase
LLCQIAAQRGARVIGTVSTEEKAKAAREAGASEAILYTQLDFAQEVKRFTDGHGVDVIYDSVGETTFTKGLDCLRPRGMMVIYGQASGPIPPVNTDLLSTKGCLYLTRVNLGTYTATRQELDERSGDIFRWVGSGQLKVHVFAEYPLAEAAKAQAALEHRETIGKVLLVP